MAFLKYETFTLADRERVQKILSADEGFNGFIWWENMFISQAMYGTSYAICENSITIKPVITADYVAFQYPIGSPENRLKAAVKIREHYNRQGKDVIFESLSETTLEEVRQEFGRDLTGTQERSLQNYILSAEEQINLQGSKFSDRRNKIRRFSKTYPNWTYADLTKENFPEILRVNEEWVNAHDKSQGCIDAEQRAFRCVLDHYDELNMEGGLLYIDGQLVCFCIGGPINKRVFGMLFSKAHAEYRDATMVLQHEFYTRHCAQYEYINYSEDMGIEGLRKFKMMLQPVFLTDCMYSVIPTTHRFAPRRCVRALLKRGRKLANKLLKKETAVQE